VPDWIARIFQRCPRCTVVGVGRGARGCTVGLRDGTLIEAAAVAPRGVVNTAGAGDALFASFLHCWLATGDVVNAVESAVLHAGWMIGHTFPADACRTEDELTALRIAYPVNATEGLWDKA
jgi:sugar/nucleoside kinase (ribokinase family)